MISHLVPLTPTLSRWEREKSQMLYDWVVGQIQLIRYYSNVWK